jgi:hypothetical protein
MRSARFPDRRMAVLVALSGVAVLALAFWRPDSGADGLALELALGLSGGVAAALTFSLALVLAGTDLWPPARSLVLRRPTVLWFGLTVVAVLAAVLCETSANDGERERILFVVSVLASLLAGGLGVFSVVEALRAVSGSGRRQLYARILRRQLCAEHGASGWPEALSDVLPSASQALAHSDVPQFLGRGEEILLTARQLNADVPPPIAAQRLAQISLGYQALLGRALSQRSAVPEIGWLITQLARETACLTGFLIREDGMFRATQMLAAQTRMLNWLASLATATAHHDPASAEGMRSVLEACDAGLRETRACADPDPPLKHLPAKHPWHEGIVDCPQAAMLWLVSACEHGTAILGYASALYAVHESLFDDKYFGDYNYGGIVPDIQQRLRSELPDASVASGQMMHRWGGVDVVWTSLLAIRLAELAPARWQTSVRGDGGPGWLMADNGSGSSRWRFLTPELEEPDVDGALRTAAACLSASSRRDGLCPWRRHALDAQHPMAPPAVSLVVSPGAVFLAALLALRRSTTPSRHIRCSEAYLHRLPDRALAATHGTVLIAARSDSTHADVRRAVLGPVQRHAVVKAIIEDLEAVT